MAKDLVKDAFAQMNTLKEAAMDTAKHVLVEAMSTDLKAAVSQAMEEQLLEDKDQPGDYHAGKKGAALGSDRVGEEIPAKGDDGDDLTGEGDGPAIIETEDDDELDYIEDEDAEVDAEEEVEWDEDDDEDEEELEDSMQYEMEDEDEEVIEVVEDEEMDFDDAEEEEDLEIEASTKSLQAEVKKLRRENLRYERALVGVKNQMDEVNLFNARLAAATDLMRKVTMTKVQKERVVEHFDHAKTLGEVKRTHRSLYEGYRGAGKTKRNSKKPRIARPNVQSVVSENADQSSDAFARLNEMAGTNG